MFLVNFLLVSWIFSSFPLSSVQADTSGSTVSPVLSSAEATAIDTFIATKIKTKRSGYSSDIEWNAFLNKVISNINVAKLKPEFINNPFVGAVLDRVSFGIKSLVVP